MIGLIGFIELAVQRIPENTSLLTLGGVVGK